MSEKCSDRALISTVREHTLRLVVRPAHRLEYRKLYSEWLSNFAVVQWGEADDGENHIRPSRAWRGQVLAAYWRLARGWLVYVFVQELEAGGFWYFWGVSIIALAGSDRSASHAVGLQAARRVLLGPKQTKSDLVPHAPFLYGQTYVLLTQLRKSVNAPLTWAQELVGIWANFSPFSSRAIGQPPHYLVHCRKRLDLCRRLVLVCLLTS
jgi:hypothetical protein